MSEPRALCAGALDLWYDETSTRNTEAIRTCHRCELMWPCRYKALEVPTHDQFGVQGGLSANQRITIRRRWLNVDWTVMRERRRAALAESWQLRQEARAA